MSLKCWKGVKRGKGVDTPIFVSLKVGPLPSISYEIQYRFDSPHRSLARGYGKNPLLFYIVSTVPLLYGLCCDRREIEIKLREM